MHILDTDILSLLQAIVQRSIDSDEVRRLSLGLVRELPQRMRNVGRVPVNAVLRAPDSGPPLPLGEG